MIWFVLLFATAFVCWTLSTLSAGGGSVLFVAMLSIVLGGRSIAPVVTIVSLIAAPVRMAVFWHSIDWRVVVWYMPGAICGVILGGWLLTRVSVGWLDLLIAMFLVSTAWQYRMGDRARSFRMPLAGFIPLSFVVGVLSAMIGASGLVASPFYLNHGLIKQSLLATRAANSLAIQLTKVIVYLLFGVLNLDLVRDGLVAGAGAGAAILLSRPLLDQLDGRRFRQFAVVMMAATGMFIFWRRRELLWTLARLNGTTRYRRARAPRAAWSPRRGAAYGPATAGARH